MPALKASHHLPGVSEGGRYAEDSQSKARSLLGAEAPANGAAGAAPPMSKPRSRGLQAFNKALSRKESGSPAFTRHAAAGEETAPATSGGTRSNCAEETRGLLRTLRSYVHAAREPGAWPECAHAELGSLEKQLEDAILLTEYHVSTMLRGAWWVPGDLLIPSHTFSLSWWCCRSGDHGDDPLGMIPSRLVDASRQGPTASCGAVVVLQPDLCNERGL